MGAVLGRTRSSSGQLLPNPAQPNNDQGHPEKRGVTLIVAEGVGFEPTDSFLSSAFKALALGRYANPPGTWPEGLVLPAILAETC